MPTEAPKIESRKIADLKNHPLNARVFGELGKDGPDAEFVESIKERGVLTPLVILPSGTILSGHRRRQGAARAGLKEVPCLVRHDLQGVEADFAWFDLNRQREMTNEERARWYRVRLQAEELAAKERQKGSGGDQKSEKRPKKSVTGNSRNRSANAKEAAATDAGLSPKTADKASEVVHAIDEAEAAGDAETASDLRETLNHKSVAAAHRKATGKKTKKSNGKEKTSAALLVDGLTKKHIGHVARGLTAIAKANGGEGKQFKLADAGLNQMIAALQQMRKGEQ